MLDSQSSLGSRSLNRAERTTNAADALLVDVSRAAGTLLMEAMWTRYLLQSSVIIKLVAGDVLGDIRSVYADHGQAIPADPNPTRSGRGSPARLSQVAS